MKFKATLQYDPSENTGVKIFGSDNSIKYVQAVEIEFTFLDLLSPDFVIQGLLIPWLKEGNIPKLL